MSIRFRNHRICPVPPTDIPFTTCPEHNHKLVKRGDNVDVLMIHPIEKGGTQAPSHATPDVLSNVLILLFEKITLNLTTGVPLP